LASRAGLDDLEKRKFLTLPGLELRPFGRPAVASRYTDYAISAPHFDSDTTECDLNIYYVKQFHVAFIVIYLSALSVSLCVVTEELGRIWKKEVVAEHLAGGSSDNHEK
jgi:hypothetical protein